MKSHYGFRTNYSCSIVLPSHLSLSTLSSSWSSSFGFSPAIHGCMSTIDDDSADEPTMHRCTPTADWCQCHPFCLWCSDWRPWCRTTTVNNHCPFPYTFHNWSAWYQHRSWRYRTTGQAYLVVVTLQIGDVGSLFKHIFATSEVVYTLPYEFVYHMISVCRFVAHPHVMPSVIPVTSP